ncbi:hypothetical protein O6H91_02G083500 [Diphasiastrum complanatum]|nr:hypothetical protein O6H91_02G083500 [Diphasiastrum complanatum]KAJ7565975.1 hypothetical protein O6H91_02G083500 [Diphasiastrum complanatum]
MAFCGSQLPLCTIVLHHNSVPVEAHSNTGTPGAALLTNCCFVKRLRVTGQSRGMSALNSLKCRASLGGDGDFDLAGEAAVDDYYSVLGVRSDATSEEIKKAYHECMKVCHPDLSGNHPETTTFCVFVNEVYEVLSDPEQRIVYDEINGYALTAKNPFLDDSRPLDHTFVDEFTCIGCKNCANTAPVAFEIEEEYGRARVVSQMGNPSLVQQAIQTCPVDCIHWVSAPQLALLEDEMRRVERVNVGMMLAGMGYQSPDVFSQASWRWEKRQAQAQMRAKLKMMKERGSSVNGPWWQGIWSEPLGEDGHQHGGNPASQDKAARAAAAARRWREYSRQGIDRRSIGRLPSKKDEKELRKQEVPK